MGQHTWSQSLHDVRTASSAVRAVRIRAVVDHLSVLEALSGTCHAVLAWQTLYPAGDCQQEEMKGNSAVPGYAPG